MDELTLTRSKAKHPPSKTVAEAQRIKAKVMNSDTKRRSKNVGTQRTMKEIHDNMQAQLSEVERQRLSDRREFLAEKDARTAGEVDEKANRIMRENPEMDYGTATRMALSQHEDFGGGDDEPAPRLGSVYGTDAEMRQAVERRMAADPEHYGSDESADDQGEQVGSVHQMSTADYEAGLKEAAKARGYDV